jgi:hypothetical protein
MNPNYAQNLSLLVTPDGPTIKKHELSRLIGHLPENADIYLFTKLESVERAAQISAQVGTNVLSFSLTGDVIEEPHGISLVARAAG